MCVLMSSCTTPADRIRALTGGRRIKPTSLACRRSRRPEPGRHSTYQAGKPVQANRASSIARCLTAAGRVADMDRVPQVEVLDHRGGVSGVVVHVVAVADLGG